MTAKTGHFRWDRRLDVRAVARRVLSQGPAAREGAGLCRERLTSIEVNGTFYRTQIAGHLPQMGERSAGRLRVLAEGLALRHQPPRAQGGGRLDQAVSRFRRDRAWAASSDRCSGNSRRSRNSTRPTSAASWSCCRTRSTAITCGMSSRCGTTASSRRSSSRCCASSPCRWCSPTTSNYPVDRRRHRRLRLCAPAAGRGHGPDRLSAEGDRRLGRPARRLGEGRRAGRPATASAPAGKKGKPRDVLPTSSTRARCARRRRRWR